MVQKECCFDQDVWEMIMSKATELLAKLENSETDNLDWGGMLRNVFINVIGAVDRGAPSSDEYTEYGVHHLWDELTPRAMGIITKDFRDFFPKALELSPDTDPQVFSSLFWDARTFLHPVFEKESGVVNGDKIDDLARTYPRLKLVIAPKEEQTRSTHIGVEPTTEL